LPPDTCPAVFYHVAGQVYHETSAFDGYNKLFAFAWPLISLKYRVLKETYFMQSKDWRASYRQKTYHHKIRRIQ